MLGLVDEQKQEFYTQFYTYLGTAIRVRRLIDIPKKNDVF
jgi:hypothetical protein